MLHLSQKIGRLWRHGVRGHDERILVLSRRQNQILRPFNRSALALLYQRKREELQKNIDEPEKSVAELE
ncbi:MAG: hypothetical protein RSD01_02905 [Ruthenibacterium sp.]